MPGQFAGDASNEVVSTNQFSVERFYFQKTLIQIKKMNHLNGFYIGSRIPFCGLERFLSPKGIGEWGSMNVVL